MKKEIDAWVWNPKNSIFKQKKSEKAIGHIIYCECPEKCELYAKGYCLAYESNCPHGSRGRVTGYSRMASKFYSWIRDFEQEHKEVYKRSLKKPQKMEYFMDFVYIPIHLLNLNKKIEFVIGGGSFSNAKPVIKREYFNEKFITEQILNFYPLALFGGIIHSYQKEDVPKFLLWLKQLDPQLYEKVKAMNPDSTQFTNLSNVGRKAILQTLTPNVGTFTDIHGGVWTWDGEYLYSNNTHASFTLIETREISECRLKPKGKSIVKVESEEQVNENTEFID